MLGKVDRAADPREVIRDTLDLAALGIAGSLIGLVATGTPGLPRLLLALAFAFFVPGRAIVANWPRLAYWSDFGLPIVISLAVVTVAAAAALWAHLWHPVGLFEIEAGVSVIALAAGLERRHRRSAGKLPAQAQQVRRRDPVTGSPARAAAESLPGEPTADEPAATGQSVPADADQAGREVTPPGHPLEQLLRFYSVGGDSHEADQASSET